MRRTFARRFRVVRRDFATVPASASSTTTPVQTPAAPTSPATGVQLPPRVATRNALKAAIDLGKRTIPYPERLESVVGRTIEDLQQPRKPVVAFWGEPHSGVGDLVTALLEDPLSDDQARRNALVGRHDSQRSPALRILSSSSGSARAAEVLSLKSRWLDDTAVELLEVTDSDPAASAPLLLAADHIVLVVDNIRFTSSPAIRAILNSFATHPSLRVVLNRINTKSSTSYADEHILASQLAPYLSDPRVKITVTTVSSTDALEAIDIFRSTIVSQESSSAAAARLEIYQQKSASSAISQLSSSIGAATKLTSTRSIEEIQVRTGVFLASYVLASAQQAIDVASSEALAARERVTSLRDDVQSRVGGLSEEYLGKERDLRIVQQDLDRAKAVVKLAFERFHWWKLPWRVDDVGTTIRDAIVDEYGRGLEGQTHYHCGRLTSAEESLGTLVAKTTDFPPSSPFHSPVLLNTLAQQPTPQAASLSSTLLRPLVSRRTQLIDSLVPHLQVRAQRAVASFYVGSFGSAGGAWASWFIAGWVDAEVALALGLVGLLGSLRWSLIGGWEKAQKRFWEGWSRVGDGLARDVKAQHEQVVPLITRKATVAADGLEALVATRTLNIDEVNAERSKIADSLANIRTDVS